MFESFTNNLIICSRQSYGNRLNWQGSKAPQTVTIRLLRGNI